MLSLVHLKVLAAVARHGSVTEAAKQLHYSQPSVSHHLSRLEAATGVKLVQRIGRGIRLTPEGQLLANRAAEILGRVDAATSELAAQVGLQSGRGRRGAHPAPTRTNVARAGAPPPHTTPPPDDTLATHRHSPWIGGCAQCQADLNAVCRQEGFAPRIASH